MVKQDERHLLAAASVARCHAAVSAEATSPTASDGLPRQPAPPTSAVDAVRDATSKSALSVLDQAAVEGHVCRRRAPWGRRTLSAAVWPCKCDS